MNFDYHDFRRTVLGACGAALLGTLLGGCVSWHKPRFWDKDDVTTTSAAGGSPSSAKPSSDAAATVKPAAAPTVVAADHAASPDSSAPTSVFDFSDPTPSAASGQNTLASDSQPAAESKSAATGSVDQPFSPIVPRTVATDEFADPNPSVSTGGKADAHTPANDPFAETATSPPAVPAAPTTSPAAKPATPSVAASPSKTPQSADPFADTDSAAIVAAAHPQSVAKSAPQPAPTQAAPTQAPSTQPPAPPQAATPPQPQSIQPQSIQPQSIQPQSIQPQPASPEPARSPEPGPVTAAEPPQKNEPSASERATPVAALDHGNIGVGAFAEPSPPPAPTAPAAPIAVNVAENKPSCGAPASMPVPCAAAAATPGTPAAPSEIKSATAGAWLPVRAPASAEQVSGAEASASSSDVTRVVIQPVKTPAAPEASPEPSLAKAPSHEAETIARHEPATSHAAVPSADAPAANSMIGDSKMICDSKSVRGRFTGIGHSTGEAAHHAPPKEAPRKPPAPAVPMSRADAAAPNSPASEDANVAAPQTATAATAPPAKPQSGVVNAIAHQIGHGPVADPFVLEQTVDSSTADSGTVDTGTVDSGTLDPVDIAATRSPQRADTPRAFHPDEASVDTGSTGFVAEAATIAPNPPHEETPTHLETWFAIGIGVGLAASLAVWLRLRPKNEHALNG